MLAFGAVVGAHKSIVSVLDDTRSMTEFIVDDRSIVALLDIDNDIAVVAKRTGVLGIVPAR